MVDHEQLLARLVGFDTTSARPNRPCIEFIRDYLDGFGIKSSVISGTEDGKACLWATIGPAEREGVVLSGHSDVVPVAGQNWTSDPFQLTEREGKLYGRGSCDMKAFIACALSVVPTLAKEKLDRPIHLALTHDEETDMSGAVSLTSYMKANGIKPLWTWIGEPTLLKLVDEHKGVGFVETEITGIPGHSGKPQLGLSAIELGVEYTNIIMRVAEKRRAAPVIGSRFDPPYTTFNLGTVNGGTAENIIAEHFRLIWQIRAHPGDTLIQALDEVEKIAHEEIAPRFRAFAPKAGMKTCACLDIPPLLPSPHNPGCDILKRLTGNRDTGAVSFGTEAGFFQQLGAPVVICGPGDIEQAHKADEFVSREQLASCVTLLQKTLAETTRAN